jgi:hypothetical protein
MLILEIDLDLDIVIQECNTKYLDPNLKRFSSIIPILYLTD